MKLSEFKEGILDRYNLIKLSIYDTWQNELSYPVKFWANLIAPISYVILNILFITILYSKVKTIAGYSRDEMLFFLFIVRICFDIQWQMNLDASERLNSDVNNGDLDLLLTKPIPALFYISIRKFPTITYIRTSLPVLLTLSLLINWSILNFNIVNIIFGILIIILGLITLNSLNYIFTFPVFWGIREGYQNILDSLQMSVSYNIPTEGLNNFLKVLFIGLLPVFICSNLAVSVFLGKFDALNAIIISLLLCSAFKIFEIIYWKLALKNYSSASS